MQCDECEGKGGVGEIQCGLCAGKGLIPFKMPEPVSDEEAKKIFGNIFKKPGDKEIIDELFDEEDPDKKIPEN
jgi:hypothetical protein